MDFFEAPSVVMACVTEFYWKKQFDPSSKQMRKQDAFSYGRILTRVQALGVEFLDGEEKRCKKRIFERLARGGYLLVLTGGFVLALRSL